MLSLLLVVGSSIVQIILHMSIKDGCQDVMHPSLEVQWSTCKPKGHDVHAEGSVQCHERCLPHILRFNAQLIISHFQIELQEDL